MFCDYSISFKIIINLSFLLRIDDSLKFQHLRNVDLQKDQRDMVSALYRKYLILNNDILELVNDTQYNATNQSRQTYLVLESYLLERIKVMKWSHILHSLLIRALIQSYFYGVSFKGYFASLLRHMDRDFGTRYWKYFYRKSTASVLPNRQFDL